MDGLGFLFLLFALVLWFVTLGFAIPVAIKLHRLLMSPVTRRTFTAWRFNKFRFSIADGAALTTMIALLCGIITALDLSKFWIPSGMYLIGVNWWRGIKRLNWAEIHGALRRVACLVFAFPSLWAVDAAIAGLALTMPTLLIDNSSSRPLWVMTLLAGAGAALLVHAFLKWASDEPIPPKDSRKFPSVRPLLRDPTANKPT